MKRKTAMRLVKEELIRARKQHPPFNSAHEGYAVLLEEVDELWAEIKKGNETGHRATSEAVQIAAMAVSYLVDLCDEETVAQHEHKVSTYRPSYGGGGYSG